MSAKVLHGRGNFWSHHMVIKSSTSRGKNLVHGLTTASAKVLHGWGNFVTGNSLKDMGTLIIFASIYYFTFVGCTPPPQQPSLFPSPKGLMSWVSSKQVFKTNEVKHFLINSIENGVIAVIEIINMGSHHLQSSFPQ